MRAELESILPTNSVFYVVQTGDRGDASINRVRMMEEVL